jgi:hypothetical protein
LENKESSIEKMKISPTCPLLVHVLGSNFEPTPKSLKPLNPLKGTLKSLLIFIEFLPTGGFGVKKLKINELGLLGGDTTLESVYNQIYSE